MDYFQLFIFFRLGPIRLSTSIQESIEFPYALMLGDNQCFQAFAIINGAALEQSTLLAAVDVCFKAFYVFDINCPKQCSPVWQFPQTVVYGLSGKATPAILLLEVEE